MKLDEIVFWLDETLNVAAFDDVSNNGIQVARGERDELHSRTRAPTRTSHAISTVAFAVDASVRTVKAAAEAGAQLLVVHHGISWGGGIRRLSGGVYNVVKAAMEANLAIYACHLPLDAHPTLGNNAQIAKRLGLKKVRKAFDYHGNVIGLIGESSDRRIVKSSDATVRRVLDSINRRFDDSMISLGVCSGGAGEFAEEAKRLGCDLYLTGEASWGDVIAAENCGMKMICAGHYETEVYGVRAVAAAMKRALKVRTVDLTEELR